MKKLLLVFTALFSVLAASTAQTPDEKNVTAVVEQLRIAMIDANKDALENLTADELSYGHSGGAIEDKNTFVEKIVSGKSDFTKITLEGQTIKMSGDVAIVRHRLLGETLNDGTPGTVNLGVLLIWQKQKGKWKLLARQAVKL